MNRDVIIVGAGGHGKVVADIVRCSGDRVLGFLDDVAVGEFCSAPILGKSDEYDRFLDAEFLIAIGNAKVRQKKVEQMKNACWYTAIHPAACVSQMDVSIGCGSVIMPQAVINAGAFVGAHCIINSGAIVEHDNVLENYVHAAVGAKLCGTVFVGARTWLGAGAVVCNDLRICADCMIGAGSVVIKDIEKSGTYVGVPARRIR